MGKTTPNLHAAVQDPVPVRITWAVALGLAGVVAVAALSYGLSLRRAAWHYYAPVRFAWDIQNAFHQGREADEAGSLLARYEQVYANHHDDDHYGLDYPPARLLIARTWYRWLQAKEPGIRGWRNERELTWPLLWLNLVAEVTTALGIFALVLQWTGRAPPVGGLVRQVTLRVGLATAAGLAAWFNPALMLDAHAWPQWDAWLLPFAVWAMVAATADRFTLAGLLLTAGAMLKGQILLGAPVLLAWPLMQGRPLAAARLVLGVVGGFVLAGLPWIWTWTGLALAIVLAAAAVAGMAWWRRWPIRDGRWAVIVLAGFTLGMLLGVWLTGTPLAWLWVGFGGGYPRLSAGPVGNLPSILVTFGWRFEDVVELGPLGSMQLRVLLQWCYVGGVLLCGFAAARQARRRDRRVLVSLVLPWALMFALMMQMHERYLMYAAVLSASWLAVGAGPTLMHAGLTTMASLSILANLIGRQAPEDWAGWSPTLQAFFPGIGWALLVLVAAALVYTTSPSPRSPRPTATPPVD